MADTMRTESGAPSQTAREKHGGPGGKFPIFDHKSAHSALQLRGHAPDPAAIIARVRAWANANGDKAILAECDAATEADKKSKSSDSSNRSDDFDAELMDRPRAPIELRAASAVDVNYSQRLVTVIVAPYEQPTPVMWKDEIWTESFERSAWSGIEKRPNRVRANRAHDRRLTCGKVVKFFPDRTEGLVADIRMAQTPLGNETLELAKEDCLSVSAGFGALPADQLIDQRSKTRRIKTAYLDHVSFVENPAYPGAEVLSVRENELVLPDMPVEPVEVAPSLDELYNDPAFQWARERLQK